MTSSDVRSILNLPQAGGSSAPALRKSIHHAKKPDGISRELYALIGDSAPSLAEAQASLAASKNKFRPKPKGKRVRWEWIAFTPAGREANPVQLHHWARVTDDDPNARVDYFGTFNKHGPTMMEYSQYEYDQHLTDPDWTPHETAYLFDLLRQYDLRFIVAADRYSYTGPTGQTQPNRRSIEVIKDRYYTICRRLVRTRTATDPLVQQSMIQAYSFDRTREIKRKQYASELFHLTAAEIAEEEALFVEIKRMEQNQRRYGADRDDLLRRVMGLDSGLVNLDQVHGEGVVGMERNKKRKRFDEIEGPASPVVNVPLSKRQKEDAAFDAANLIYRVPVPPVAANSSHLAVKHPVHQPVFLRSSRLPVPKASSATTINLLIEEMGINPRRLIMPTRENLDILESLFQASAALVDMKRQMDRVELELKTLRAQKADFIPPIIRQSTAPARSTSVDSSGDSTSVPAQI